MLFQVILISRLCEFTRDAGSRDYAADHRTRSHVERVAVTSFLCRSTTACPKQPHDTKWKIPAGLMVRHNRRSSRSDFVTSHPTRDPPAEALPFASASSLETSRLSEPDLALCGALRAHIAVRETCSLCDIAKADPQPSGVREQDRSGLGRILEICRWAISLFNSSRVH